MTEKRHFDIPSDKKVRLVVIGIIIVSIIDVILFGSLVEADVAPFGRLTLPDRILLGTPLFGILWIAFAGFGRKHTRGYFFRYRYGQTLCFVFDCLYFRNEPNV